MGIKNLTSFLKCESTNCFREIHLNELKGKKAAIDVSIWMYRFKYRTSNIIPKFLEQINRLRINGIVPIYIFDGIPSKEKREVIIGRKNKKTEYKDKIDQLSLQLSLLDNPDDILNMKKDISKLESKLITVTKEDITNVKNFLDNMKIKYLQAEGEADFLCSKLCSLGIVDFVISEDMDLLTSGTKLLLRDFNIYNNKATLYDLDMILNNLDLSYEKWVELCILFGCDYVKRINRFGPKKSYKCIKDNRTIEDIINDLKLKNVEIDTNYIDDFNNAKKLFMNYSIDYLKDEKLDR